MNKKTMIEVKEDDLIVKVSICQACGGWVRGSALSYFQTSTKARNEFMREVAKYNLAVQEITLTEWRSDKIHQCNCKN